MICSFHDDEDDFCVLTMKMEAASSSRILVFNHITIQYHNSEDNDLVWQIFNQIVRWTVVSLLSHLHGIPLCRLEVYIKMNHMSWSWRCERN